MGWVDVEVVLVKLKWSVVSQDRPWSFSNFPARTRDDFIGSWLHHSHPGTYLNITTSPTLTLDNLTFRPCLKSRFSTLFFSRFRRLL